ncbi:phosphoribosylanthranilate isomerase [Pedobacter miscanthi]|jgi:phosphoribosylanthranilate isomerase|uniref:phosphoribosylanthranilate isomerase n=1 Tax=Pedobacter miscanthi TaxID=2259170 RepID=UPI0029310F91|nr:phosphoribosylanthranilate isomerase [Pedobacter miscanthi]
MLKLKVCGMRLAANIAAVAELQPDYLGFIFYEKSPRLISEVSAELIKYIPSEIKTVGVFVNEELEKVKEKVILLKLKAVQLHGNESPAFCESLKSDFASLEVIKSFGIDEDFDFSTLEPYLNVADYFLFDTKTKAHGGSGKTFNWPILANYTYSKPYFLSGGIDLEHTTAIKNIQDERLFAIDINSRFEIEPGLKDVEQIKEFIKEMSTK